MIDDPHRTIRRPTRRRFRARTMLHVGIVLGMLGALLLVPVVAASAGGDYNADLSVSQTDTPDPVTSANDVLYAVTVTNNGPAPASDVMLQDTLDPSVVFVSVDSGNCEFNDGGFLRTQAKNQPIVVQTGPTQTVDCTFDGLEDGMSAVVNIVVQAPSVSETAVIQNQADVWSDETGDDNYGNNSSVEQTTVQPQTEGQPVTGYIPPEGGKLTTDTGSGVSPGDTTVLTEKFGPGPGGQASVQELNECATDPDLGPCVGNIGDFTPPPGYDKVVAVMLFDRDAVRGGLSGNRKMWKIVYQKNGSTQILDMCGPNPTAGDVPCWKSIVRVDDRNLRVRALINSDPKLATRK